MKKPPRGFNESEAESFTRLGAKALQKGDNAGAAAAAQIAVKANPKLFTAWLLLGASLARLKHHKEAVDAYIKALTLNPTDIGAWADLGELYVLTMQYGEAVAALKQAMLLDPDAKHPAGRRARAVAGRTMALLDRG